MTSPMNTPDFRALCGELVLELKVRHATVNTAYCTVCNLIKRAEEALRSPSTPSDGGSHGG